MHLLQSVFNMDRIVKSSMKKNDDSERTFIDEVKPAIFQTPDSYVYNQVSFHGLTHEVGNMPRKLPTKQWLVTKLVSHCIILLVLSFPLSS